MSAFILLLTKAAVLMGVFYLVYALLLKHETHFTLNRWYLLGGLILSLVLPNIFFTRIHWIEPTSAELKDIQTMLITPDALEVVSKPEISNFNWSWMYGLLAVYVAVALIILIYKLIKFTQLYIFIRKNRVLLKEGVYYIDNERISSPFSFFNTMAYNASMYSKEELQAIYLHEQAHIKQKHSIDVLFMELYSILFWFVPWVYLYRKALKQNLEYLADEYAIKQSENRKFYQLTLLKFSLSNQVSSFANSFYQPLIKNRIMMLNKPKTRKLNYAKLLVFAPILLVFFLMFQTKTQAKTKSVNLDEIKIQRDTILNSTGTLEVSPYTFDVDKVKTVENVINEMRGLKQTLLLGGLGGNPIVFLDGKRLKTSDKISLPEEVLVKVHRNNEFTKQHKIAEEDSAIEITTDSDGETIVKSEINKNNHFIVERSKDKNEGNSFVIKKVDSDTIVIDVKDFDFFSSDEWAKGIEEFQEGMSEFSIGMEEFGKGMEELSQAFSEMFSSFSDSEFSQAFSELFSSFDDITVEDFDNNWEQTESYTAIIKKDTSDKEIGDLIGFIADFGVDVSVSNLKRNKNGEIYGLKVKLSERSVSGNSSSSTSSSIKRTPDNPIQEIELGKVNGRLSVVSK